MYNGAHAHLPHASHNHYAHDIEHGLHIGAEMNHSHAIRKRVPVTSDTPPPQIPEDVDLTQVDTAKIVLHKTWTDHTRSLLIFLLCALLTLLFLFLLEAGGYALSPVRKARISKWLYWWVTGVVTLDPIDRLPALSIASPLTKLQYALTVAAPVAQQWALNSLFFAQMTRYGFTSAYNITAASPIAPYAQEGTCTISITLATGRVLVAPPVPTRTDAGFSAYVAAGSQWCNVSATWTSGLVIQDACNALPIPDSSGKPTLLWVSNFTCTKPISGTGPRIYLYPLEFYPDNQIDLVGADAPVIALRASYSNEVLSGAPTSLTVTSTAANLTAQVTPWATVLANTTLNATTVVGSLATNKVVILLRTTSSTAPVTTESSLAMALGLAEAVSRMASSVLPKLLFITVSGQNAGLGNGILLDLLTNALAVVEVFGTGGLGSLPVVLASPWALLQNTTIQSNVITFNPTMLASDRFASFALPPPMLTRWLSVTGLLPDIVAGSGTSLLTTTNAQRPELYAMIQQADALFAVIKALAS